jgi:uncharacterized protein (DUF362 family)
VVALAREGDELALVERALDAVGGLGEVRRGDLVVLKVNTNSGDPYPYSTSPALVAWLAARLRDGGARVVVGDRSFWGDEGTRENFERNGIEEAARRAGAELVAFEPGEVEWVEIAPDLVPSWRPPVRIPALVRDAAHVVNLPCLKTHFITGVTLALKNLLGVVHPGDRARPGNLRSHHPERIHQQIAEIHRAVAPRLHLIDAHQALVSGGPTPTSGVPTIVRAATVIASTDAIACDVAGIERLGRLAPPSEMVSGIDPWAHPTIVAAVAAGVGIDGPERLLTKRV